MKTPTKSGYIKISEFAKLSGISRKNLIAYDRAGLLKPAYIDEANMYRYYSYAQLETALVLRHLRSMDISLDSIRNYMDSSTPSTFISLLKKQRVLLEKKIQDLYCIIDILDSLIKDSEQGLAFMQSPSPHIQLTFSDSTELFISSPFPQTEIFPDYNHFPQFFDEVKRNDILWGFSFGLMINQHSDPLDFTNTVGQYFLKFPNKGKYPSNFIRPKGHYVTGHISGDIPQIFELYSEMILYINQSHLRICGNTYIQYLYEDVLNYSPNKFIIQISIQVEADS